MADRRIFVKPVLSFLMILLGNFLLSQNKENLINSLKEINKDVILESKLILIQQIGNDAKEIEAICLEINKTADVYKNAKLSGGMKGFVAFIFVPTIELEVKIRKMNLDNVVIVNTANSKYDLTNIGFNALIDSNNDIVNQDIPLGSIYKSIHQHITR